MTRFEALVSLNLVPEIGSIRLKRLLEYFGSPENILKAGAAQLTAVCGIGEKTAINIKGIKPQDLSRELSLAKKLGLKILTLEDPDYPENLKNIYDPPIVLYVRGELKQEDKLSLGIVGSRRASVYGLTQAGKFAQELSGYGFTIVSGMARGIDTSSHRGALLNKGRTIAVMGSGFNHIYPEENKELAERIAGNGAVVSEFPVAMEPLRQNFPCRNRVISGLSLGVLIVEAARNSGALITADFALEQGREVFALPGNLDNAVSFGPLGLIKQGAKLVTCAEDILEELLPTAVGQRSHLEASLEEEQLLGYLSHKPACLDELREISEFDISQISAILLKLQMKKLVKELPGKQFVRNQVYE